LSQITCTCAKKGLQELKYEDEEQFETK